MPADERPPIPLWWQEASFALDAIAAAVAAEDPAAARSAYEFGRDSWNSYLAVVNRAIVEKVGDKLPPI